MKKLRALLIKSIRFSLFDYGSVVAIEFWRFHITIWSTLYRYKGISTPYIKHKRQKGKQWLLIIELTLLELEINYNAEFSKKEELCEN